MLLLLLPDFIAAPEQPSRRRKLGSGLFFSHAFRRYFPQRKGGKEKPGGEEMHFLLPLLSSSSFGGGKERIPTFGKEASVKAWRQLFHLEQRAKRCFPTIFKASSCFQLGERSGCCAENWRQHNSNLPLQEEEARWLFCVGPKQRKR